MQLTKALFTLTAAALVSSSKILDTAKRWQEWAPTCSYCPSRAVSALEQQAIFDAFVRTFYVENNTTAALTSYVSEEYIQHNPYVLSGRQPAMDFLKDFTQNLTFTVQHTGFDGNLAWVHLKVEDPGKPVTAIFDLYRFDGSCIAEHWDVIQELPENAPNPLALF
jgi:predicted SnoaL-like aldol condensation-catalyzing enzyme